MKIKNLCAISRKEIETFVGNGGRFIQYHYCISLIVVSFKKASPVYLLHKHENKLRKGLKYSVLSVLFGWWGFPLGLVYTTDCLVRNFKGGNDITADIIAAKPVTTNIPEQEFA